ncbi:MAG: glycosyltransferase family 9 protein [Bdellovibrionota bacterium]
MAEIGRIKVLLIRLDKIGDLVCTLPVDEVLDPKKYDVTWVIQKGLSILPTHSVPPRKFIEVDKLNRQETTEVLDLWISENKPGVAVSFNAPWWINFSLWKHKIPWRGGVKSQWHSFLFLNHALRQRRSQAVRHEADYNRELLDPISQKILVTPTLKLQSTIEETKSFEEKFPALAVPFVVVHPGMMGSALNWPTVKYMDFIAQLSKEITVVITGTKSDDLYTIPVVNGLTAQGFEISVLGSEAQASNPLSLRDLVNRSPNTALIIDARYKFSLEEMLVLLAKATHVYAPSTGVLHLAASVGTNTTGFYSPIQVHRSERWGARAAGKNISVNITPDVPCPADHKCHGPACIYFNCMNRIAPMTNNQELKSNPSLDNA